MRGRRMRLIPSMDQISLSASSISLRDGKDIWLISFRIFFCLFPTSSPNSYLGSSESHSISGQSKTSLTSHTPPIFCCECRRMGLKVWQKQLNRQFCLRRVPKWLTPTLCFFFPCSLSFIFDQRIILIIILLIVMRYIFKSYISRSPIFKLTYSFTNQNNFNPNKDYYLSLGVSKTASESQIKSAYYKLAKKYHPDHNPSQPQKFKQISEAYSVLSDAEIKRSYDQSRFFSNNNPNQQSNNQYQRNPYEHYHNQWNNQQHENEYRRNSSRQHYENPYEAYNKFREQYIKQQRQRMKRYQEYTEERQKTYRRGGYYEVDLEEQARKTMKMWKFSMYLSVFFMLSFLILSSRKDKVYIDEFGVAYKIDKHGNRYIVDNYGRPVQNRDPYQEMGMYDNRNNYTRF